MICDKCNFENNENAKFCENCGNQLGTVAKHNGNKKQSKKNPNRDRRGKKEQVVTTKSLWVVGLAVIAGFLIYSIIDTNSSRDYRPNIPANNFTSGNSVVEAKVYEIASNFVCGCGSCGEESLDECKCNFAVEERQFIRDYLEANQDKENVIFAVNEKYGGLKTDINVGKSIKPTDIIIPESDFKLVATFNDRLAIYSQFQCPCGQCGIDELKDCTCNHKNGAVEVKGYIDSQIALNLYSIDEIVSQVAIKYGGKKL